MLTNEKLKGLFRNNFDLANFAISIAKQDIEAGREITLDSLLEEVIRSPKPQDDNW